jgi:hypothetical protein
MTERERILRTVYYTASELGETIDELIETLVQMKGSKVFQDSVCKPFYAIEGAGGLFVVKYDEPETDAERKRELRPRMVS